MKTEYIVVVEQFHSLGLAYLIPNFSNLPLISYRLVLITTAYSIGFQPLIRWQSGNAFRLVDR